jgi:hypothetical protein
MNGRNINEINELINNLNIFYNGQWYIKQANGRRSISGSILGSILTEIINQENNINIELIYNADIYIENNQVLILYVHQGFEYIKYVYPNGYVTIFFRAIRMLENY